VYLQVLYIGFHPSFGKFADFPDRETLEWTRS
jgi:hypothetical protein